MPRRKETVTMRLDADLLEWFRRERGYQTRSNAILRAYMNAQTNQSSVTLPRRESGARWPEGPPGLRRRSHPGVRRYS